jgi:hypothetical protein
LKACGVVTGATAKRNRFVSEISPPPSADAEKFIRLIRRPQAVLAVPPAQFIHQMLEVGREVRRLRKQGPLQLFTHGVADRSARPAIDLLAVVGDSAIHDEFRFWPFQISMRPSQTKSQGWKMFPAIDRLHGFPVKIE